MHWESEVAGLEGCVSSLFFSSSPSLLLPSVLCVSYLLRLRTSFLDTSFPLEFAVSHFIYDLISPSFHSFRFLCVHPRPFLFTFLAFGYIPLIFVNLWLSHSHSSSHPLLSLYTLTILPIPRPFVFFSVTDSSLSQTPYSTDADATPPHRGAR
jgi:hypothetical protein